MTRLHGCILIFFIQIQGHNNVLTGTTWDPTSWWRGSRVVALWTVDPDDFAFLFVWSEFVNEGIKVMLATFPVEGKTNYISTLRKE